MSRPLTPKLGDIWLFVKQMTGSAGRMRISVRPWASIDDLREKISSEVLRRANSPDRLRLFCRGREIVSGRNLLESVVRRGDLIYVDVMTDEELSGDGILLSLHLNDSLLDVEPPRDLVACLAAAKEGLDAGHAPILAQDGTGGTYFFLDGEKRFVAAFKPGDEEPFCVNNPRGYASRENSDEGMRTGIRPGEAHYREVAAFLLDHDHFAGVPPTTLVEARHTAFSNLSEKEDTVRKVGSLQKFVLHDAVVEDGDEKFLPVSEVHRIAMFDIRTLNGDRNNENILIVRNPRHMRQRSVSDASSQGGDSDSSGSFSMHSEDLRRLRPESQRVHRGSSSAAGPDLNAWDVQLVPIDHGYCLPERLEIGWCDWSWLEWPQLKLPVSAEDRDYILNLDPFEEAKRLEKALPIRESALRNMIAAGILLQEGIRAGLTLYDIANIIARQDLDKPSELERILAIADDMSTMALRKQGRYGTRPFFRRGNDIEDSVEAQHVTNHVEQLCVGLASPAARTSPTRRSVGDFQTYQENNTHISRRQDRSRSVSLVRVASYGGFLSPDIEESDKSAEKVSRTNDYSAADLILHAASVTPTKPGVLKDQDGGRPQPGGALMRVNATDGSGQALSSWVVHYTKDGRVVKGGDALSKIQSEAMPRTVDRGMKPILSSALNPLPETSVLEVGTEARGDDFDHYFYGAVKLHVKPLVQRKQRLRREKGFAGRPKTLERNESQSSEPRTSESVVPSSSFVSSVVDSVTHKPVWTV